MLEWERRSEPLPNIAQDLSTSENPRDRFLSESLREILASGKFMKVVLKEDESHSTIIGKIAVFSSSRADSFHIVPEWFNLADVLKREDPAHKFEQAVSEVVGSFEIDQEIVEEALRVLEAERLQTISALFMYDGKTEIHFPISFLPIFGLRDSIRLAAAFMKITPASAELTALKQKVLAPRST